jgi:hypothetical protein
VAFVDAPISPRFLSQDDRIEIADGLAQRAGQGDRGADWQELPDPLPGDLATAKISRWLGRRYRRKPE